MNKILIPAILTITILIAASFALMPVQRVSSTHLPSITVTPGAVTAADVGAGTFGAGVILPPGQLGTGAINTAATVADANVVGPVGLGKLATGALPTAITVTDGNIITGANIAGSKLLANSIGGTELANAITLDAGTTITAGTGNTLTITGAGGLKVDATNGVVIKGIFSGTSAGVGAAGVVSVPVTGTAVGDVAFCSVRDADNTVTITAMGEPAANAASVTIAYGEAIVGTNTFVDCIVFDIT